MPRLDRVYYHYEQLEEFHAGMWRIVRGEARKQFMAEAAKLMKDTPAFQSAMERATNEWRRSCQHSLTVEAANRIAWLGHAGCCIATGSPEEATRAAWHTLNQAEQDAANEAAAIVLYKWELANIQRDLLSWIDHA